MPLFGHLISLERPFSIRLEDLVRSGGRQLLANSTEAGSFRIAHAHFEKARVSFAPEDADDVEPTEIPIFKDYDEMCRGRDAKIRLDLSKRFGSKASRLGFLAHEAVIGLNTARSSSIPF